MPEGVQRVATDAKAGQGPRHEKDSAVACALQNGRSGLGGHLAQLGIAHREPPPDGTIDTQLLGGGVQHRGVKVTAYVEQLGTRDE